MGTTRPGLLVVVAVILRIWFDGSVVAAELDELAAKYRLQAEQVGFVVVDVVTGQVLAEHQGDRAVVPASVAKVPTAIAALATLGSEYRFSTELALAGSTLVLVGGGDPLLTPENLRLAFRRLKEDGRRIDRFLYDASIWPETPEIDTAQPEASAYNPGVGALAVDFNRVLIDWKANGREASALAVSDTLRLEADAVHLMTGPSVVPPPYRFLLEGPDRWVLTNLTVSGRAWLPIKRPALNAALVVRRLAEREGVSLPLPVAGIRPRGATSLHVHVSPPLAEIVTRLLEHSNNMAAEMVGLATAARLQGRRPAGLLDSVATVDAWLATRIPGVDWTGFRRANHSGLSPDSRSTPRQMAGLVRQGLLVIPNLPEVLPDREITETEAKPTAKRGAGKGETKKPVSVLRYRAKTGTMAYARGLVGLLEAKSGRRVAFAVFVYDDLQRAAFDITLDRRLPEMPAEATAWIRRARGVERELLKVWAAAF